MVGKALELLGTSKYKYSMKLSCCVIVIEMKNKRYEKELRRFKY